MLSLNQRMKNMLYIFLAIAGLLLLLWLLGPRQRISSLSISLPEVPENWEERWVDSDSAREDLKEGVAKQVVWANSDTRAVTDWAVVYLHGFSTSRQEISPVCEKVAQAMGANLYFTRFKGHGHLSPEPMSDVALDDWMKDTAEALSIGGRIGRRVMLVGSSHGALLALWAAHHFPDSPIGALVLLAPNFAPADSRSRLLLKPWARQIIPAFMGQRMSEPQNSSHAYFWHLRYPIEALFPLMAQVDYMERQDLSTITQPVLTLYTREDRIVQSQAIVQRFAELTNPRNRIQVVEGCGDLNQHTLAGDILSPDTTTSVVDTILAYFVELN